MIWTVTKPPVVLDVGLDECGNFAFGLFFTRLPVFGESRVPIQLGQQLQRIHGLYCIYPRKHHVGGRLERRAALTNLLQEPGLQRAPVRGEDPIRLPGAVLDLPGLEQQVSVEAFHRQPLIFQGLLDLLVSRDQRRFVKTVPIDCTDLAVIDQFAQDRQGITTDDQQLPALLAQLLVQRLKTVVQPPITGSARQPRCLCFGVVDVEGDQSIVTLDCRTEGRIVCKSQITSEPNQGCIHIAS